jgi:hypothetical protein
VVGSPTRGVKAGERREEVKGVTRARIRLMSPE